MGATAVLSKEEDTVAYFVLNKLSPEYEGIKPEDLGKMMQVFGKVNEQM